MEEQVIRGECGHGAASVRMDGDFIHGAWSGI